MTEPLISIIVPVYRVESYLSRCVDSLLAQTYQNLEIILVDDGSPDQCPQICEDYAKKEERIHVIHQENRGLSGARNAGIDVAKGEYLAFVDSDDYVSDDYIQVMYDAIKATGCAISQCRFTYTKGEKLKENRGTGAFRIYRGNSLMEKLYGNEEEATWFVVAWNKLYRRDLFETIRYPEGRIHEDEAGDSPKIAYETEEDQVIAGLVAQGFGIAVVPYMDILQKIQEALQLYFPENGCSGWRRRRNGSDSLMSMDIPVSCRLLIENYVMHVLLFISVAQIMWKKQQRLKRN